MYILHPAHNPRPAAQPVLCLLYVFLLVACLLVREMTLVRHFEAAVFPLVLHLRRSLFADLAAFSSEAVAALSAAGAGADSGATQREEQVGGEERVWDGAISFLYELRAFVGFIVEYGVRGHTNPVLYTPHILVRSILSSSCELEREQCDRRTGVGSQHLAKLLCFFTRARTTEK